MFQRETAERYTCPLCDGELRNDRGELRCSEHGSFFAYGPNLVVRAPESGRRDSKAGSNLMPWEPGAQPAR